MTAITANSTIGITLSSPSYTSPIVVEPGVTISSAHDGLLATIGSWTIQNGGASAWLGCAKLTVNLTCAPMLVRETRQSDPNGVSVDAQ